MANVPPRTALSDTLSKDLKKRGVYFGGSTIFEAFMLVFGMVNDHTTNCSGALASVVA